MKKMEKAAMVARRLQDLFQNDWKGYKFAEKAILIRTKDVPGGLAWMVFAENEKRQVPFLLECFERCAYACPCGFAYDLVQPSEDIYCDKEGNAVKVVSHNGEIAVIWE